MQKSVEKISEKEYFSQRTNEWDEPYLPTSGKDNFLHYEYLKRKELVFNLIEERGNGRFLKSIDVGCGAGHFVSDFIKKGFITFGSDITKKMIDTTKINIGNIQHTNANLLCADCGVLPFPDNRFDIVICVGVLSYVPDEIAVLQELKRVAKKESLIIFTLPNIYKLRNIFDPYYYIIRAWKFLRLKTSGLFTRKKAVLNISSQELGFSMKRFSFKQVLNIIDKTGLKNTTIKGYGYGPIRFWKRQVIPYKLATRLSGFFERRESKGLFKHIINYSTGWVICSRLKDN